MTSDKQEPQQVQVQNRPPIFIWTRQEDQVWLFLVLSSIQSSLSYNFHRNPPEFLQKTTNNGNENTEVTQILICGGQAADVGCSCRTSGCSPVPTHPGDALGSFSLFILYYDIMFSRVSALVRSHGSSAAACSLSVIYSFLVSWDDEDT